jgi:hypothetical protein
MTSSEESSRSLAPPAKVSAFRRVTAPLRARPDFLVIGAMKCGTTSLFRYLVEHPRFVAPRKKEIHFFDNHFSRGSTFYRGQFEFTWKVGRGRLTGEATPYYMFHPCAPERVHRMLPEVKLIVLLRDPVKRAYSHYQHQVANGWETLSFPDAVAAESDRLAGEEKRLLGEPGYFSFNHLHYSYLARGDYLSQLRRWEAFFPTDRILVRRAEDLYRDTSRIVSEVLEFLELPDMELASYRAANTRSYEPMDPAVERMLYEHFRPLNAGLYSHLGVDFQWDPAPTALVS